MTFKMTAEQLERIDHYLQSDEVCKNFDELDDDDNLHILFERQLPTIIKQARIEIIDEEGMVSFFHKCILIGVIIGLKMKVE